MTTKTMNEIDDYLEVIVLDHLITFQLLMIILLIQHQMLLQNLENENKNGRRTKSKGKDVETSTDVVQRSIKQSNDSNEDNDRVNVNISVLLQDVTEKDDNETAPTNIKPKSQKKQQLIKASKDHDRHTQSDTEQIMTEKQKKRRQPKRISRTTQTYECVFRRIECGEHEELRPTTNTEKNIQTRKSQLCPPSKSSRKRS